MKIDILKALFKEKGIPKTFYEVYMEYPLEKYCLNFNKKTKEWETYYSERGRKTSLKKFNNEREACLFFFELVYRLFQRKH